MNGSRTMDRKHLAETVSRRDADAEPPRMGSRRVSARCFRFMSVVNNGFRRIRWHRDMNCVSPPKTRRRPMKVLAITIYSKTGAQDLPWHSPSIVTTLSNYMAAAVSARVQAPPMMLSASPGNIDGAAVFKIVTVSNLLRLLYSAA